ncbi:hypothetical protein FD754_015172 [Muntiacus muntjak]|uniref:Calponin-homology (CH) domain-containing protein n=1 Tax=Muntiacus muntjak TaxID=9888 RepID=A0A5N3VPJ2_MUNMU|nr:hypothetical protein FD754_015172 [Muntiacus muntjak]
MWNTATGCRITLCFLLTVSELQEEGMNAINLPLSPIPFELDPEDTMLEENEVRTMVDPNSRSDPKLQELMKKLESEKLNVAEVTQSEIAQKQKLQTVLEKINETLKLPPRSIKWNVDTVHAKSLVAILHLLVALSQYFRAPIRLPDHVSIQVVVVQKRGICACEGTCACAHMCLRETLTGPKGRHFLNLEKFILLNLIQIQSWPLSSSTFPSVKGFCKDASFRGCWECQEKVSLNPSTAYQLTCPRSQHSMDEWMSGWTDKLLTLFSEHKLVT